MIAWEAILDGECPAHDARVDSDLREAERRTNEDRRTLERVIASFDSERRTMLDRRADKRRVERSN